ncbi:MAG: cytochrome C oxidase Cbb3 [Alphaproteobacteria bacterium]|nr:MAG: cytochrome C oxidase Cbb3 [Alphaproteobacteria bacterium]
MAQSAPRDAAALYRTYCASCHGPARLGGMGPALLPENLRRLRPERARKVIAEGRAATQMPAFAETLSAEDIAALAAYIYRPPATPPVWGRTEIEASREVVVDPATLPEDPVFDADPLNLFVVVESGDHHVTILDGDRFTPITRFPSRYALHGGPKFSPDGRFVYFASRDGWITKYDLYSLQIVAEVRAGINTRNLAISHDGRVVAVANYLPHTLVLLDARDLAPLKVIAATDARGRTTSRVSAVYQAAPRQSFVVALKDVPELWEISYAKNPPPAYGGLVHSYEKGMVEAIPTQGTFPIRRIALDEPLDDFFFDPTYRTLIGSARDGGRAVVVHLDVRRAIAEIPLPGLPHLGSGISWRRNGRRVMATPHLKEAAISVIDMTDWSIVKRIRTLGPGFFLRSHENSPYAWADVFFGKNRDAVHVIDKQSLEIVRTLRPAPGKTAAHVEFTRDGRYALLSIWDMDGAIVVYDARTLEEVKRIPMVKPSGKYNVYNKIHLSEGTSH